MTNPASVTDIEERWRPLSTQENTNAQAFLGDAWEYLTSELPTLEQRITDGEVTERNVVRVVCAMVLRVLRNPDGKVQESIDDYAYTRGKAVSDGLLYATDGELSSLSGGRSRQAFSISPSFTPHFWQTAE